MKTEFQHRLTKADHIVGVQAVVGELARGDRNRNRVTYELVAVSLAVLIAVDFLFPEAGPGLLAVAVALLIVNGAMSGRWGRLTRGASYDPSVGDVRLEISDDGINERTAGRDRRWDWSAVRNIHDRGSVVVFQLAGWDMVVLPAASWPDAEGKERFLAEARDRLPPTAEILGAHPEKTPELDQIWVIGSLGAAVDAAFGVSLLLPSYTDRYGPLSEDVGFAGGMAIVLLISAIVGYAAYRIARKLLPLLHARSPIAAKIIAHALILVVPLWMVGAWLRLY